jgi:hypothetical protein
MTIRYALAAAMLAASSFAHAADWKVANLGMGPDNRGITYVDSDSVRPKGDRIRFRSEQYLENGKAGYDRVSRLSEVQCSTMTLIVLRESYHSGRALVAFGEAPRESNHYSSAAKDHWMLRRICEGKYLSGSVEDQDRDSARLFALDWSPIPGRLSVVMPVAIPGSSGTQVAAVSGAGGSGAAPRR